MKRRRFPQLLLFASAAPVRGVAVAKSSIIETQYGKARGQVVRGASVCRCAGGKIKVFACAAFARNGKPESKRVEVAGVFEQSEGNDVV